MSTTILDEHTESVSQSEVDDKIMAFLEKSKEALLLAIELYNKPLIQFRTEAFCILASLAWDSLFKAIRIKRNQKLTYKNSNGHMRSYSLSYLIKESQLSEEVKQNLIIVNSIRNSSTHFRIPEFALTCYPVFQACITNYTKVLSNNFPNTKLTLQSSFINIVIPSQGNNSGYIANPKFVAKHKSFQKYLESQYQKYSENGQVSSSFGIEFTMSFRKVNSKDEDAIHVTKDSPVNSDSKLIVQKQTEKFSEKYPLKFQEICEKVEKQLEAQGIGYKSYTKSAMGKHTQSFNRDALKLFIRYKKIKENEHYCGKPSNQDSSYYYNTELIIFIVDSIREDPDIFIKAKQALKKPTSGVCGSKQ